jgi:thiosulfate dehydrogenase
MGKFIFGMIVGIVLVPVGAYFYARAGYVPVATSASPLPFERFFAKTAMHATIQRQAPKTQSTRASEGELQAGVQVYRHHCGICHGLPGKPMSGIAKGEFPPPPQLFEPDHMVTDDPAGITYWKVKHGIRLTGMPGFQDSLSDEQIWNVSLLLANADRMPSDVSQALAAPFGPLPAAAPTGQAAGKSRPRRK